MTDTKKWLGLVGWVVVSFIPALTGTVTDTTGWFETLVKPSWNPPSWVFGPVWTTLYALMGVAAWRVWKTDGFDGARTALGLFLAHLVLNGAWTLLFFGAQEVGWALVEIIVLWLAIATLIRLFRRHDRVAAWLLVPYLLWVSFATLLNAAIWLLN